MKVVLSSLYPIIILISPGGGDCRASTEGYRSHLDDLEDPETKVIINLRDSPTFKTSTKSPFWMETIVYSL